MIIYINTIEDKCFLYNTKTKSMSYLNIFLDNDFFNLREVNSIENWVAGWSYSKRNIIFFPEKYKNYTNKLYIHMYWHATSQIPDEIKQYLLFI